MKVINARAELLNLMQEGVPLVERPYQALGERLGLLESEVIALVEDAYTSGLIRETSAIFDAQAIGYQSTLGAIKIAPEDLDATALRVSAHPGVGHNYTRDHEFNLWFTLAVPPDKEIEGEIQSLAGQWPWHSFPSLKTYKIGVRFDMIEGSAASRFGRHVEPKPIPLDQRIINVIRALQIDLPRTSRPFDEVSGRFGLNSAELLEDAKRLENMGAIRRFASVLRHREAGYRGNIMSAWDVLEADCDSAAEFLCTLTGVSHCYQRPVYSDWPYRLFAMIHAHSETECLDIAQDAAEKIRPRKHILLKSIKEYKKQRVRYFETNYKAQPWQFHAEVVQPKKT